MNILLFLFYTLLVYLIFDTIKKNFSFNFKSLLNKEIGVPLPGPKYAVPILGHLQLLGDKPNRSFLKLSEKYGGMFQLWLGDWKTVVVTDVDAVNEIWGKQQFHNFVNRPHFKSFQYFSSNFKNLSFSDYDLWISIRKLISPAFTKTKVKSTYDLLQRQTTYLINSMNDYSINNKPFNPKKYIHKLSLNIVCSIAFSKEISENEDVNVGDMKRLTGPKECIFKHLGSGNIPDFISVLRPFYYFKSKDYQEKLNEIQIYIKEIYDDHILNLDIDNPKDIMDLLIISTEGKQEDIIIQTSLDMLIAGSDTAGVMIEWFTLYMANNQDIQQLVYNELVQVIESNRDDREVTQQSVFIDYSFTDKTPYLNACIKEVLRIKPVTALGLPRIAMKDTTVNGYHIEKGTQIIQNIFGLSNSEILLSNPNLFNPDRWIAYQKLKNNKDDDDDIITTSTTTSTSTSTSTNKYYNDLDKISIPFGHGRRGCVGQNLGEAELYVACSNIILNFNLVPFNSGKLSDEEEFGITCHPKPYNLKLIKR